MNETPYQRLRRERDEARQVPESTPKQRGYPPEVRKARQQERARRNAETRRRATLILAQRYPEEYEQLMRTEGAGVDAERGPLPGDAGYEADATEGVS